MRPTQGDWIVFGVLCLMFVGGLVSEWRAARRIRILKRKIDQRLAILKRKIDQRQADE